MTTNHVADQSTHDTGAPVDASQPEQSQQAEDASRQLLAKARYDAFRLMTEARDEAEMILDEAKAEAAGTKKAAELTAASTAGRADEDSNKIIESAREEAAAIVARAHRTAGEQESSEDGDQLEAEHKALSERVSTLRSLASQLEDRFAALAATAGTPAPDRASTPTHPADASQDRAAPIIDYSPVVDPKPKDDAKTPATESDNRESFYNRRSANLPRLGEEGGRSAFNMTRLMREAMETD